MVKSVFETELVGAQRGVRRLKRWIECVWETFVDTGGDCGTRRGDRVWQDCIQSIKRMYLGGGGRFARGWTRPWDAIAHSPPLLSWPALNNEVYLAVGCRPKGQKEALILFFPSFQSADSRQPQKWEYGENRQINKQISLKTFLNSF